MIVCIAEKPSVGRDIAKILGADRSYDGFMEGNGYQVTWTFGHLCSLLEPQEYSEQWKAWSLSSLPMIPDRFGIKVMNDSGVQKQFNTIKMLFDKADMIVNCGDAGQEGELIQRWVMQKAKVHCPVKRLWISSLTEESIKEGFEKLKDEVEYKRLYEAGLCRAIGDWLLGMNATRAYTLRYSKGVGKERQVLSIGRVQTPTLALIVNRQQEIEHFVPKTYWELKTEYRGVLFSHVKEDQDIKTKEDGERLVAAIKDEPFEVKSIEKKKSKESAPRLFDLTSLQVECNKKFSFSADETLKLIQSLYEKKITTYPRVDTTYLSDDIYPKCRGILNGISDYFKEQIEGLRGKNLPKSKKVFDSKKVTDHHAIIPTGVKPNNLSEAERKVFDLVALRFIASFYPESVVAVTTVNGEVKPKDMDEEVAFKVTGRQIIDLGWRVVFGKQLQEDESEKDGADKDEQKLLPEFKKGEVGVHNPQLQERQTTPPKPYTEATLLRAMETAGKQVEDEELRDALKENGIGRPSTRAAIIEKLFQRKYIQKERKSLRATPIGVELIRTIHTPLLKSAELTGIWEHKLRQIERGELSAEQFMQELKQMTTDVVKEVKLSKIGMLCPVCRRGQIIRGNTSYGCSRWREGCTYREPLSQISH